MKDIDAKSTNLIGQFYILIGHTISSGLARNFLSVIVIIFTGEKSWRVNFFVPKFKKYLLLISE